MKTMPMTRSDKIVAALLALCTAVTVVLAASAGKAEAASYDNGFQVAKFKVEVKGWQKDVFMNSEPASDSCDPGNYSSGEEEFSFKSKPVVITATYMPGQANPTFLTGKSLAIPARAVIKRSYNPWIAGPMPAECGENGGGVDTVTKYDCGTKSVKRFAVKLEYGAEKRGRLVLENDTEEDPFDECPGGLESFPRLVSYDTREDEIGADLSQDELFDPQFQKWISIANGVSRVNTPAYKEKTTVHWDVAFTRLKK